MSFEVPLAMGADEAMFHYLHDMHSTSCWALFRIVYPQVKSRDCDRIQAIHYFGRCMVATWPHAVIASVSANA